MDHSNIIFDFISKIKTKAKAVIGFFCYHHEQFKNFYPCKLIAEYRYDDEDHTIIKYKTFGKRNSYNIRITDLFSDKNLLGKFHPNEVSKITLIAFGEIFFSIPDSIRQERFKQMREEILNKIGQ